jgi:hypothetical protein
MKVLWKNKTFYMSNLLSQNLDNYVKGVMTRNTSSVFLFDGRSGLGKTTLSGQVSCYIANQVAKYLSKGGKEVKPNFGLDNLSWTPDIFIERLKDAKKGEIVVLDESMIISNRSTMSEMNRAIIIMMSLIRSKQIFVIFNINSIFDMDKNLPLHRADMLIHLYAKDDKFASRGRYGVVPSAGGKLKNLYIMGKKYYDYSKARYAFLDTYSKFFPFDEKEYEKRKQEAINTYFESGKEGVGKTLRSRDLYVKYLNGIVGLDTEKIAEIGSLSKRTIQRCLKS